MEKHLSIKELEYAKAMVASIKNDGILYEHSAGICIEHEGETFVKLAEIPELMKSANIRNFYYYAVSKSGKVLNVNTRRILKEDIRHSSVYDYKRVNLIYKGATAHVALHRLVAAAWVKRPLECYSIVDHCDNNQDNNNAYNLRWATQKTNIIDGHKIRKLYDDAHRGINRVESVSYVEADHLRQIEAYMRGGNDE